MYGGKSGERNPQCQCVENYPKVIFPFFHRIVFGFYFPVSVCCKLPESYFSIFPLYCISEIIIIVVKPVAESKNSF
jgi:hypothetical protein